MWPHQILAVSSSFGYRFGEDDDDDGGGGGDEEKVGRGDKTSRRSSNSMRMTSLDLAWDWKELWPTNSR